MEVDGQRQHSVFTIAEIREQIMKEIDQIMEVFSLSKSDATVILIRLRWNMFKASDRLGDDDKKRFLAELGLVPITGLYKNKSVDSCVDHETHSPDDGEYVAVSTPFCPHKYCTKCWSKYLIQSLHMKKVGEVLALSCPKPGCAASVGPDTIVKLTPKLMEIYDGYVLASYMAGKSMKWCPAPGGCDYAIELGKDVYGDVGDEDDGFGVVCVCGHIFCWSCKGESHRPVTCNNALTWLRDREDKAKSLEWTVSKTKPCPVCNLPVKSNSDTDVRLVTCVCSNVFCWNCLGKGPEHNGNWNCVEVVSVTPPPKDEFKLRLHLNHWDESQNVMQQAKSVIRDLERYCIPKLTENFGLGEEDIRALREAWMLVLQCLLVLKWSGVFGYFLTDYQSAKVEYLNHLRDKAAVAFDSHKKTLDELVGGELTAEACGFFRHRLEATTATTGGFFHDFVKAMEGGFSEVKVNSYDDAPMSSWFCDRCTFQNNWFDKECAMCFVPSESPAPRDVASSSGHANNIASTSASAYHLHHVPNMPNIPFAYHLHQVPNMPNNPFAPPQQGTNLPKFGQE
ncbi:unnamed protein product [Microthlaspi erraticum]|uniref:RBR-type E3 ubiquitin transferase n=1 Tax=Microthlaspi erraticum TaxID=1685480 RepID=A0A6D2IG79_9BRAS|nr:unnamed protein product [Microthlaspi erraticum]